MEVRRVLECFVGNEEGSLARIRLIPHPECTFVSYTEIHFCINFGKSEGLTHLQMN